MKRILCTTLALFLLLPLLFACAADDTTVKVGVLAGTTGMGAVKLIEEGNEQYEITIYPATNPNALLADLTAGKVDMAAIPTNAAAKLYNKTEGKIRVLALNTLGVLHLVDTTGTVTALEDLEGKTVYVPMAGQNPEYVLRHLLREKGISATVVTDISDADALATALLSDEGANAAVRIAVLPQPKVTVLKSQNANLPEGKRKALTSLDLSLTWDEVEDTPIAQGCLVARTAFLEEHPAASRKFLKDYKASVEYIGNPENLDAAADLIAKHGIIPKAPLAKAALPYCAIEYRAGKSMKDTLVTFYEILYGFDPASVGGALPGDGFYYDAD